MARGDRSRSERTSEDRERDREERERRRAERNPGAPPPEPPVSAPDDAAEQSVAEEPVQPPAEPVSSIEEPEQFLAEPEPFVAGSLEPDPQPESFEQETQPLEVVSAEPQDAVGGPEPVVAEPPEPEPVVSEPETPEPEPEPTEPEPLPVAHEPEPPAAEPEPGPEPFAPVAPEEHQAPEESHEPVTGEHAEEIEPIAEEPVAPAAKSRLGTPPPSVSERKRSTRAGAVAPGAAAAGAGSRGRPAASRIAALIALGAVLIAVVVAVVSLSSKSKSSTPSLPPVVNVLIPEGKTRAQISEIAKAKGLKGSYRKASRHSALLNPVHYGAPKDTPDLEGFLFPATYEINKGAQSSRLVEEQLTAFPEHFGPKEFAAAKTLKVTPYELLTVASLVEREAQIPSDRAKIAAVIYNRLAQGIPIGIDASIYYAVEQEKGIATYTKELTEDQLKINSPYNTRTHTGLPPTPISNPGVASIQAAAHPAKVSYLYYVAAADGCGEQVFSDTQAQFETNVAAYKAAVEKNGGHPPTCKKK